MNLADLPAILRTLRREAGIPITALAGKLDLSPTTLSAREAGTRRFPPSFALDYLAALSEIDTRRNEMLSVAAENVDWHAWDPAEARDLRRSVGLPLAAVASAMNLPVSGLRDRERADMPWGPKLTQPYLQALAEAAIARSHAIQEKVHLLRLHLSSLSVPVG